MSLVKEAAFIGCGQAGGNIVSLFADEYNSLFINTSEEDLRSLKNAKRKYQIANAEGASKDINKAMKLVADDYDNIIREVDSIITEQIVFVVGALGGGSGNALVRIISEYLATNEKSDNRIICPVLVLPNEEAESLVACSNVYEALKDLESLNVGAMFLLDNKKKVNKFAINSDFYHCLDALLKMSNQSKDGNIDKSELKTCLSAKGVCTIHKISKDKTNAANIISSFNDNKIFAPIEKDVAITYIALSLAKKGVDVNDIIKGYTVYDSFLGYGSTSTLCILVGMSMPVGRITEIRNKIKTGKKQLASNFQKLNSSIFEDDDEDDFSLTGIKNNKPVPKPNSRDFLVRRVEK
ncbi:Tubulin/FtsZ family, GTPase domain [Anaerosporobacter mobilis DSM 15930]|jgi:hypothetical protein|uniref:Tubulin/FtsZ family, GTPase domain n=1 Tax=Anaerosporobacter mobilis DSM 15930 TaxID=1120996 RepID=A0A1M7NAZ9_9FIRM|nr:hypothetical protein [Anaerosporobacter mobilis]SHN00723.1 Tubulin/FtsZ family, GTPase domain [Anaerosporobacter mobilis DSM 15930]